MSEPAASHAPAAGPRPLLIARACAWALLVAGWVGLGALALPLAASHASALALVALWLLVLGAAAAMPRPLTISTRWRAPALLLAAAVAAGAMWSAPRGGGLTALIVALLGWAALAALASGVVRALRLQQKAMPRPPVASAALGALAAGVAIGNPGDAMGLSLRLAAFAAAIGVALVVLQARSARSGSIPAQPGCRAGLFDCSLPAWPAGAWRDGLQWPTLLAGLAMLPMMAELPLLAAWCRGTAVGPVTMLWLHLGAMFLPAWLLSDAVARWPLPRLSAICATLLGAGAALVVWAPAPWDWTGLAVLQGAAWSLAWSGLLWAPARRGSAGSSPLVAATGYALLTALFGLLIEIAGARGAAAAHAALGATALAAWTFAAARGRGAHPPRQEVIGRVR